MKERMVKESLTFNDIIKNLGISRLGILDCSYVQKIVQVVFTVFSMIYSYLNDARAEITFSYLIRTMISFLVDVCYKHAFYVHHEIKYSLLKFIKKFT